MKRHGLLLLALCTCAACTQFPALDDSVDPAVANADFPALIPLEPVLARADTAQRINTQTQAGLEARVAALRARAARLRGSVLTGRERQRLAEGLR